MSKVAVFQGRVYPPQYTSLLRGLLPKEDPPAYATPSESPRGHA